MKRLLTIVFMLLISNVTMSKFILDTDWETITQQALMDDSLIEVEGSSKHFNIEEYDLTHLKFVESGKNKRKTY